MHSHDYHYRDVLQPAERDSRERARERNALYCPPDVMPERPDVEQGDAHRLRRLAADFIAERDYLLARANGHGSPRTQVNDTEEIRQLCKEAAEGWGLLIERALMAAERHEALSNVCTRHQGAT